VSGRSRGRLSVAGLLCFWPGVPARLCYRLRRHSGRKGERRSLGETDYIRLLDGAHQLLKAPLIVVWDRLSTHISKTMKALVAERDWLTVVLLPGYAPDLNPVEGLWAHIKRSLANLAARTLSELEALLRKRLKALQYRHSILDGFLAGTGLTLDRPDGPSYAEVSKGAEVSKVGLVARGQNDGLDLLGRAVLPDDLGALDGGEHGAPVRRTGGQSRPVAAVVDDCHGGRRAGSVRRVRCPGRWP